MAGRKKKKSKKDEKPKIRIPIGEKLHIRVECDNCMRWEFLSIFKRDLNQRTFLTPFLECKNCRHIVCGYCLEEETIPEELLCPFCGHTGMRKPTPREIFICNQCLRETKRIHLCKKECRYPEHKETRS
ncbi:hypothetical protein ACFLRC_04885 [Candidatus Altiarchaeota archaeon]